MKIIVQMFTNNKRCYSSLSLCLLFMFPENDEFAAGIHKMVWNNLKKEECLANAERWFSREAARLDSVQKAGTLR